MTLEEQRINSMLSENFDRSKWPGLTPTHTPDGFEDDCITSEQFFQEGRNYLKQLFDNHYGTGN